MLITVLKVELKKLAKARILPISIGIFIVIPLIGGFFMMILKNPDLAKKAGIISTKASLVGIADWPSYFSFLSQAISIGGLIVFGFLTSWIFGREYSDKTIKDLLALPIPRIKIVWSKFITLALWILALGFISLFIGLIVARGLSLPGYSGLILFASLKKYMLCLILTLLLCTPVGFIACLGKGFLAPLSFLVFTVASAQIVAVTGYGEFYPWAIPALISEMAGPDSSAIGIISYILVFLAASLGSYATIYFWTKADQS